MFAIVITDRGGAQRQLSFDGAEVSIGRLENNDIILPKTNVSKRHARLVQKDNRYVLLDMKSTNGTYVNGRRIAAPMVVRKGDKIYIGDFILTLGDAPAGHSSSIPTTLEARSLTGPPPRLSPSDVPPDSQTMQVPVLSSEQALPPGALAAPRAPREAAAPASEPPASLSPDDDATIAGPPPRPPSSRPPSSRPPPPNLRAARERKLSPSMPPRVEDPASGQGPKTSPAVLSPSVRLQGALHTVMERLAKHMDVTSERESAFPDSGHVALRRVLAELTQDGVIGADVDHRFLTDAAVSEAVGLGPLDRLLSNNSVREVVVDGPGRILADLGGGLNAVSSFFSTQHALLTCARRLFARSGKPMDPARPVQECLLPGGKQVSLLLPPVSPRGVMIVLRSPPPIAAAPEGLITEGALSIEMLEHLRTEVRARRNILVVGPVRTAVSALVSAIASLTPDHERLCMIEDSPSLSIDHPQQLPLHRTGATDLSLAELLRYAERLHYDRLVLDDVRHEDLPTALQCAAASDGILLGTRAVSPEIALDQLMALPGRSTTGHAHLLSQAVQLIVHVAPSADGARRVHSISRLGLSEGNRLSLRHTHRL